MEKKSTLPELLAPAGNLETALAAFDAGADAVYGGLVKFNARERAANFSSEELGKLLSYAHGCGRRVYLTFNTLLREQELDEAAEFLAGLARLRPDALIVQDLAVVELCRSYFPQLVLHASTQMGIHNSAGVAAAAALGIRRVILERQVTLEELRRIAAVSPVELEVFVHGSLCCSLSGRCLLSSALGGWSGNRGKCKQPCRRCYEAGKRHGFLLSPKDLEGVELLPEFRRLGIASLKIEGRLRGPEYVWKTVRAYRMLLDSPGDRTVEEEARQLLRSTATRRPSNGFFRRDELGRLIDFERPGVFGVPVGTVGKVSRAGLSVRTEGRLHLGDRLRLVPPDGGEGSTFSLISLRFRGMDTVRVRAGAECFLPGSFSAVPGSLLYKIGENGFDFSRRASTLPAGRRAVTVTLRCSAVRWEGRIDGVEERWLASVDFAPARQRPLDAATVEAEFAAGVPEPWEAAPVHAEVEGAFFVPSSTCRELRRNFWEWAAARLAGRELHPEIPAALERFRVFRRNPPKPQEPLPRENETAELRIPAFLPEGELPKWRERIQLAYDAGGRRFRIGGIHGLELLRPFAGIEIIAEFPLPVTNSLAAQLLREEGVCAAEPFAELDRQSLAALRTASPLPLSRCAGPVPLLVTRAVLPARGEWRDERGRRYRVAPDPESGVTLLFAAGKTPESDDGVEPFYSNEWK